MKLVDRILHKNFIDTEPNYYWFKNELKQSEHTYRMAQVYKIRKHLLRQHSVLDRLENTYYFKNQMFVPAAIVLQGLKTIVNFHVAYLVGNPVSLTGTPEAVEVFNKYYKKGLYSETDWKILTELVKYGNAFEYVYLDDDGVIRSKVLRNQDAYPIYDDEQNYRYFVDYNKDGLTGAEYMTIYFPDHVDKYINGKLIESKENLTGLPIHYVNMDRAEYDQFGDSMLLDLIPIQDKVEGLLSKLDDAVTTLSLNPIGVMKGNRLTDKDIVSTNVAGAILNLDIDGSFGYANATMDYNSIKYEMDQLYQQFNMVAAVPSSILGQSNISNVSESTTSIIYQLTENRGKQNMQSLMKGFCQRWQYMRRLISLIDQPIIDEDFDSLNVNFIISKPVDTLNDFVNMKTQYDMGAISKKSIIELSPYTSDLSQELQRIEEEKETESDQNEEVVTE